MRSQQQRGSALLRGLFALPVLTVPPCTAGMMERIRNGGFEDAIPPGGLIYGEPFDQRPSKDLFVHTWGDPATAMLNGAEARVGVKGAGGHLRLKFTGGDTGLSYWNLRVEPPVPIGPELGEISFQAKGSVSVSIKIGMACYGFIYHGPATTKTGEWQKVAVTNAYEELKKWCASGNKPVEGASVSDVIVCVHHPKGQEEAEVFIDDVAFTAGVPKDWPRGWLGKAERVAVVSGGKQVRSGQRAVELQEGTDLLRAEMSAATVGRASLWARGNGTLKLNVVAEQQPAKPLAEGFSQLMQDWHEYVVSIPTAPRLGGAALSLSLAGQGSRAVVDDVSLVGMMQPVKVAAISLIWDKGYRTLHNTLRALEEARVAGADIACLPEDCVETEAEPIPGPTANAIAARAKEAGMYVVANLRERDAAKMYHTSVLFGRDGSIVGKYRKSHRMPSETIDLGNELPVFQTDFGAIGLMVGTDYYFQEIPIRYRRLGARIVVWSTTPFPVRDEYPIDSLLRGRATELQLTTVVATYAGREGYGGYPNSYAWTATWPIGRACVIDTAGHTIGDSGHAGGVATAVVPAEVLRGEVVPKGTVKVEAPSPVPAIPQGSFTKRWVRVSIVESGVSFEQILKRLDICGRRGTDIAALGEYVWYNSEAEIEQHRARNQQWLDALAAKAKEHHMYVVVAGELLHGYNEAYLFDREGKLLGRYTKILQTTPREWKTYREGKETPVFLTDFGRIAVKICNDTNGPDIDYQYGLKGADLVFFPTMDCGPYDEWRELRHRRRCIDNGFWMISTNYAGQAQTGNRSFIMDPWGFTVLASVCSSAISGPRTPVSDEAGVLTTVIELDRRPGYFEFPKPPIEPSDNGLLRILPREPEGQIDLLCLRSDGKTPTDEEFRSLNPSDSVVFLRAADCDSKLSVAVPAGGQGGRFEVRTDPQALAGRYVTSAAHGRDQEPVAHLTYRLPPLRRTGDWVLWARVIFPGVDKDSFYWQYSPDGGKTWNPLKPSESFAVGWAQPTTYQWVQARPGPVATAQPVFAGDLREVIRKQRRPELYAAEW